MILIIFFAAKISAFCFETPSASTSLSLIFNDTKNLGLCFVPIPQLICKEELSYISFDNILV